MHRYFFQLLICALLICFSSCNSNEEEFTIEFEKYTLENGLEVILHKDSSDPIVAVTTLVHVGSSREKPGRTGFAHFFEHMSFNDSENVPRGANRKMIPELGGVRNGGTWSDGTIYYEVVPKDAFEKILWIDSDRMGFMINTVTDEALEREKQVVKNEKRERVDNNPYGHTGAVGIVGVKRRAGSEMNIVQDLCKNPAGMDFLQILQAPVGHPVPSPSGSPSWFFLHQ